MQTNSEATTSPPTATNHTPPFRAALVLGALGVVFGDIGTSPIYTLQTLFDPADPHPVPISTDNVYGIVSLIFWSVMIIVTLTYITLVMRADNDGEGGIMALITMLKHGAATRGRRTAAMLAGAGPVRCVAVLRRQHDHAGDLGAVRGRGHQGRHTAIWSTGSCRSPR